MSVLKESKARRIRNEKAAVHRSTDYRVPQRDESWSSSHPQILLIAAFFSAAFLSLRMNEILRAGDNPGTNVLIMPVCRVK